MQPASIQDAKLNKVKVDVKSSFTNKLGTQIIGRKKIKDVNIIRGVSFTKNDAKVSLLGVKDKPGVAAAIFEPIGVFGQIYWYSLYPLHQLIFAGMIKAIADKAIALSKKSETNL